MKDTLGDRCKFFESLQNSSKAMPHLPLFVRLDGKNFHNFTKGLTRPYDSRLTHCMVETTKYLVDKLQASVGYTQSDEITLLWYVPSYKKKSSYIFDGRAQKIVSVTAGMASAVFTKLISQSIPEKAHLIPCFDSRTWQVPTLEDMCDVFIWREDDATKNSVSMAASTYFSHKQLHLKNSTDKLDMLFDSGIHWADYPSSFKRGTYVQKKLIETVLTDAQWEKIPVNKRPDRNIPVTRHKIVELDLPPVRKIANLADVLLHCCAPMFREA